PGNIRELENLMERTVLFADGPTIRVADLPENIRRQAAAPPPTTPAAPTEAPPPPIAQPALPEFPEASMKEIVRGAAAALERDLIVRALEETGGNVTQAARKLKISRKSLQNKMKEFGLRDPEER